MPFIYNRSCKYVYTCIAVLSVYHHKSCHSKIKPKFCLHLVANSSISLIYEIIRVVERNMVILL